jgi:2-keto-3-deoxy-L-rhamnonate aldolase RhmA
MLQRFWVGNRCRRASRTANASGNQRPVSRFSPATPECAASGASSKITAITWDAVNNELLIVPMIETNQALENLDDIASVPGVDVLLIGPSDLSIELGVPLDYQCDIYQRALDKIAAIAARHGTAGMYFIPPGMDPNFFVQKGFRLFTMPGGPWATAGIQNALAGIER